MILKNFNQKPKRAELYFSRFYYFAFMGGAGAVQPFVNLFYTSLGLNGKQIGTIASAGALTGLFAAPFIVSEIKKRPHARSYLQIILILGAFGYFLLGQQSAFLPIIGIIIFQSLATSSILPLSDSMAVSIAESTSAGYGSIRVWGSMGWIVIVPATGWLIEHHGFQAGFTEACLIWIVAAGLVFFISPAIFSSRPNQQGSSLGLPAAINTIWRNRTLLGFAIAIILIGFLNSGVLQFENVYLSDLGASKQLISIAGILSAIVEIPFMLLSDQLLKRISAHRMMLIAILLTFVQRSIVLIFPSIITIMIVRFIGGMAYSFYTISYIRLISSNTETHETGTVLALFTVTMAGAVNIIASPISGAIYDLIGARWLYAFSASGYMLAAFSLWVTGPDVKFPLWKVK